MAFRKLYPVRLLDGHTSGGVQIILFQPEDGKRLIHLLSDLLTWTEAWQKELLPAGSIALELSSVCTPQDEKGMRAGVIFRVRMPRETGAAEIDQVCRELGEKAVKCLTSQRIACDTVLTDELEGIVSMYPANGSAHLRFYTKERRLYQAGGTRRFYFSSLSPLTPLKAEDILRAVSEEPGRGISLHLLPMPSFEAEREQLEKDALKLAAPESDFYRTLLQLRNGARAYSTVLTVWGSSESSANAFSAHVQSILRDSGLFLACQAPRFVGDLQTEQLVHDPWSFHIWCMRQVGVSLAYMALMLTGQEIGKIFPETGTEQPDKPQTDSSAVSPDLSVDQYAQCLNDAALDRLMEKLKTALPVNEFLAIASDILNRLDTLSEKTEAISGQTEKIDAIMRTQETVYLRRMNALEQSMKETVEQSSQQVLGQLQIGLEKILRNMAELPDATENAKAIASQIEALIPKKLPLVFTEEERNALGIESDDDLAAKGMLPEEIRLLHIALALARLGLSQQEENAVYMPFAAPMGCLYEIMVRNSFDPNLTDHDLENRREEIEKRQQITGRPERRLLPDCKEKTELSFYDYISNARVYEGYFRHVTLEGKKLSDPMAWNTWFACFKCVRAIRNKVHTSCGDVSREELQNLYRLMLCPGAAYKWAAIRYLLDNPSANAGGTQDPSLLIRHYGKGSPFELQNYITRFGATEVRDSLILFLLRVRAGAQWKEFAENEQ